MRTPVRPCHHRVAICLAAALGAACADPVAAPVPAAAPLLTSALGDPLTVGVREVAAGLSSPIAIVSAFDGSGRLFIVDQIGVVRVLTADGTLLAEPFLDVRSRMVALRPGFDERGLLGLAFHPQFATNGRFFVYYNAPPRTAGFDNTATFAEYRASADADRADLASERIFLQLDDPQFNHNGGTLAFGRDGFLYMSIGDGGQANDCAFGHVEDWYAFNCGGNGQDVEQNLFGNILRIDVNGAPPYGIPADNPFVGKPGRDEVYAYGFRNPYRFSFDKVTGRLFVGDAGQGLWEEVSLVEKGGNYGWNVKEGTHCFSAAANTTIPPSCPSVVESGVRAGDPLVDPIIEYANAANRFEAGLGRSVVGGVVYRGDDLPQLSGRYVFGDWSRNFGSPQGTLFAATERKGGLWRMQELAIGNRASGKLDHFILGFGQDEEGEVYVGGQAVQGPNPTGTSGKVFKLVGPSGKE